MKKGSVLRWLLEANQQAECYKDLPDRIKHAQTAFYAFVKHTDEQDEKGKEHMHAVLEFQSAKVFEEVQDLFPGAHLEELKDFDAHMAYLLHRTPTAREQGKQIYFIQDLTTSDIKRAKCAIANGERDKLDPNHILDEINGGCTSITKFVAKFRPDSVKQWTGLIKDLLKERKEIGGLNVIQDEAFNAMKALFDHEQYDTGPYKHQRMQEIIYRYWDWVNQQRNKVND